MRFVLPALCITVACSANLFAGSVIDQDFNSGVFVSTSTRPLYYNPPGVFDPAPAVISGPADYDWAGPGDDLDGWVIHIDAETGVLDSSNIAYESIVLFGFTFDISVAVPNGYFGQTPTGSNHIGGNNIGDNTPDGIFNAQDWVSTDGNIGDWQKAQNDVPKGGWSYTVALDSSMGGARNASGEAVAFTVMYDAELNYIKSLASKPRSKLDASVVLGGVSHDVDSSMFSARDVINPGEIDVKPFTPAISTGIYDSDDSAGLTARETVTSGIIEQTVANGEDITFRFQVAREGLDPFEPGLGIGVDNLKVVALEAGDADGDLDIDNDDIFLILGANKFGAGPSNATWAEGDFDDDGDVDNDDIFMVLGNGLFGAGSYASTALPLPAAASTVPEPATLLTLAGLGVGVLIRRRGGRA